MDGTKLMKKIFGDLSEKCVEGPTVDRLYMWDENFEVTKVEGTMEVKDEETSSILAKIYEYDAKQDEYPSFVLLEDIVESDNTIKIKWSYHTLEKMA